MRRDLFFKHRYNYGADTAYYPSDDDIAGTENRIVTKLQAVVAKTRSHIAGAEMWDILWTSIESNRSNLIDAEDCREAIIQAIRSKGYSITRKSFEQIIKSNLIQFRK